MNYIYIYVIHIWPGDVCIYPLTDFRWFRHQCLLVLHVMTPGPSPVSASPRRSVLYRFRHDRRVWQGNIHKLRDMCFMFVVTDLEYWHVNSKHWTTASIVKVQVTKDVMSVFQKSCGSCVLVEGFNRCCFYYPQTMAIYYVHVECLKDCVIHWLIGWSIDWLVDWLIDSFIHSLMDWLVCPFWGDLFILHNSGYISRRPDLALKGSLARKTSSNRLATPYLTQGCMQFFAFSNQIRSHFGQGWLAISSNGILGSVLVRYDGLISQRNGYRSYTFQP